MSLSNKLACLFNLNLSKIHRMLLDIVTWCPAMRKQIELWLKMILRRKLNNCVISTYNISCWDENVVQLIS